MIASVAVKPILENPSLLPSPHLLRIRDLVYQVSGIFHPDHQLAFLEERCQRRATELRLTNLRDYLDLLTAQANRQNELIALLHEMTVGETCFFRNAAQLEALRRVVLPKIVEERNTLPVRRLKIWSAGCSTGEEAYTLAILLLEESKELLAGWDIEIQATDLSMRSVAHARRGIYGESATRNLPPEIRRKYFVEEEGGLSINQHVRTRVNLQQLSLLDDSRMTFMKGIDIIFCCHVLIYFDGAAKHSVIQHFRNSLLAPGYLFLGSTESLLGNSEDFRLIHLPSTTAYRKTDHSREKRLT